MRKIKLLIALCLSLLCVGAVTANAATMATTTADEVALFGNLGFTLPQKAAETDPVTRAEFVGTITQFINTEFAAGGEYSFTDVPKDDPLSGALNYAVAMGIVSDDTLFNPENNVTYPQAMKMAVAFLGRSIEAESLGGYDGGGYSAIASTYKLYAGLQDMAGEYVTYRDFIKILYNIGNADMLVRDTYGNLYTGNTPFEEYYNMYHIRGIVTGDENTTLTDNAVTMPDGVISIYQDMYRYDGDAPMGYSVEGWASYEAGDMPKIVMLKEYKNEVTELKLAGLEARLEGNMYYYENGGKEAKIKLDSPEIVYNNIAAPTMTLNDILNCKLGTIEFISNDDDDAVEVISIMEYRPVVVSVTSKQSMRIVDKNGDAAVLLDNDGKVKGYTIIKGGEEVDLTALEADELLAVYESRTKSHIYIEVEPEVVSGTVTSYNSVARTLKIGDTVYNISDYFNRYYMSRVAYNNTIDIAVSSDGVLHAITTAKTSSNKFGWVLRWYNDKDTEDLMIRMADEKGDIQLVKVSDKVKLDGQSTTESALKTRLSTLRDRGLANLFIKYSLNEEGTEIKIIDTYDQLASNDAPQNIMTGSEDQDNNLTEYNFPKASTQSPHTGNFFWNNDDGGWAPYVTDVGKVFLIIDSDSVEDEEKFVVKNRSYLYELQQANALKRNGNGWASRYRLFNVDRFGTAEACLIVKGEDNPTITSSDPRGLLYRLSSAVNLNGEITYEMVVFSAGSYKTYFVSEDYYKTLSANGAAFATGDYIAYKVDDVSGDVSLCEVIYDKSARTLLGELTTPNYYSTSDLSYITGWIYDIDGKSMSVIPSGYFNTGLTQDNISTFKPETGSLMGFPIGSAAINIISPDGKSVSEGSMGDVTTFIQSPEDAEFVIMRFDEGILQEVILYK